MRDQSSVIHIGRRRDIAASLEQVDRHIAEGRTIIRRQIGILRQLREDGLRTDSALGLLAALRETVGALRRHRQFLRESLPPEHPRAADETPAINRAEGA